MVFAKAPPLEWVLLRVWGMRRCTAAFVLLIFVIPRPSLAADLLELKAAFDKIVRSARANVGVSLVHLESGASLNVGGDQRFPMASVYKLPIAIELLTQVARGRVALDRQVSIAQNDIRACCTLSRHYPRGGITLTVGQLLELMIVESDNTAADMVLKLVGGPSVVQKRLRSIGHGDAIRVDRYEGDINFEMTGVENPPPHQEWTLEMQSFLISEVPPQALRDARVRYLQDPRDSATPNAMTALLAELQAGLLLPRTQTAQLLSLMCRSRTGPQRLRGLLPEETVVAHKTGTTTVVINDVGVITLPEDSATPGHLVMAVFVTDGGLKSMQRTIAKLSGAAFEYFTGRPLPKPAKIVHRPSSISDRRSSGRHHRPSSDPEASSMPIDDGPSSIDRPSTQH